MWLSPPIQGGCHIPVVPKAAFCGSHCLNGGGFWTPPQSKHWIGVWVGLWDGMG